MSTEDLLHELKLTYLAGLPSQIEEMETCVLAMESGTDFLNNYEAMYRRAHSLKGSGGTYGITIISSICHQLEDYLSDNLENNSSATKAQSNDIFKFIDLLKDVHTSLINENNDLSEIENRLNQLQGNILQGEINCLLVGDSKGMQTQICVQVLKDASAHYAIAETGSEALQRCLHEHFDFIITPRENNDLNGLALIAAIKLNQQKTSGPKAVLITSKPPAEYCDAIKPDFVILKDKSFNENLGKTIAAIKNIH